MAKKIENIFPFTFLNQSYCSFNYIKISDFHCELNNRKVFWSFSKIVLCQKLYKNCSVSSACASASLMTFTGSFPCIDGSHLYSCITRIWNRKLSWLSKSESSLNSWGVSLVGATGSGSHLRTVKSSETGDGTVIAIASCNGCDQMG